MFVDVLIINMYCATSCVAADRVRDGAGGGVGPARAHGGVARRAGLGRAGRGRARRGLAARRQAHDGARGRRARHLEHARAQALLTLIPTRSVYNFRQKFTIKL